MNIIHLTDLHFNKSWFKWIENQIDHYDVFCITGDFLDESKKEPLKKQVSWLVDWFKKFPKPLFVCTGNHDIEYFENENWLVEIDNIYSDSSIKTINGIKFGCIPYIAPDFSDFYKCEVILYHVPPAYTKTSIQKSTNKEWGDIELSKILKKKILKPIYLLCGHLHIPTGKIDSINQTIISNPGSSKTSQIPNHYIIDI